MSAHLDERYFNWLYGQVCSVRSKSPAKSYRNLLHVLYTKEFIWLVPNDDNRVEDGKELRYEFLDQEGIRVEERDQFWLDLGCSFLELLIGVSRRLEFETDRDCASWFWELLENLGLDGLNDKADLNLDEIDEILERVTWRTYSYDGTGGLFPLEHSTNDQRKVEIWYQLSSYILERSYA